MAEFGEDLSYGRGLAASTQQAQISPSSNTSNGTDFVKAFSNLGMNFDNDYDAQAFMNFAKQNGMDLSSGGSHSFTKLQGLYWSWRISQMEQKYGSDYLGLQHELTNLPGNVQLTPDYQQWLNNMIATQNTQQNQQWEENMRDTELISSASQLSQLGLNPASVLSVGGSRVNGVDTASNSMTNTSMTQQQMELQKKTAMSKAIIGLIGGMASAGIGGASLGLARGIGAKMASSTAKSMQDNFENIKKQNERYRNAFMALGAKMSLR